jgi:hypothetical protein
MSSTREAIAIALLCGAALTGCRKGPAARAPLHHRFGPVIGSEVIAGWAEAASPDDGAVLLVGEQTLVRIDLTTRRIERRAMAIASGTSCWGLARLRDGSLWTLLGRRLLVQISERGQVLKEIPLDAPHFGLFADSDRLLLQPAEFQPPAPVLYASVPGAASRTPWSSLRSRPFNLARASVAALNMITCGVGHHGERPCWFPDEAAIALVDGSGATRRVPLPGIEVVRPEVLLTSDNPARPVRDAYVDSAGTIWVLSSGVPVAGAEEQPGGWMLARYSSNGERQGTQALAEPVRLILRAELGRAVVLTASGMVAEVVP